MSKRGSSARTRVKKRKGVGVRVITVQDSDEGEPNPEAIREFARVTKTRVSTSGKAEMVSTSNTPIFEAEEEWIDVLDPLGADADDPVFENIVPVAPAKQRQRANDSVSYLTL